MENLACIAFVFAVYCLWACAAHCPKKTATPAPIADEPQPETKEEETPTTEAVTSVEIVEVVEVQPAIATTAPVTDLSTLPIRSLYTMAKGRIKGFKKLSKSNLIAQLEALGGLETAQIA